jgi:hypothetical protein
MTIDHRPMADEHSAQIPGNEVHGPPPRQPAPGGDI